MAANTRILNKDALLWDSPDFREVSRDSLNEIDVFATELLPLIHIDGHNKLPVQPASLGRLKMTIECAALLGAGAADTTEHRSRAVRPITVPAH